MALSWRKDYIRYKELFLKLLVKYRKRDDVKAFLEVILSLITITFFSIFALKPTVLTITELVRSNKEKERTIQKMDEKIRNIQTAQNVYRQNAEKIPLIKNSVPDTPSPDTLIRQIEGIANLNSVIILGSSVDETLLIGMEDSKKKSKEDIVLPEGARIMNFSVSTSGNYSSLFNFLSNLGNMRRPIIIESVNLTANDTDSGKVIVMLITGKTTFQKTK